MTHWTIRLDEQLSNSPWEDVAASMLIDYPVRTRFRIEYMLGLQYAVAEIWTVPRNLHEYPTIKPDDHFKLNNKKICPPTCTTSKSQVEFFRQLAHELWLHELDEQLLVNGQRLFDPHARAA